MIFLTNINLSRNELQNAVIQPLAVAPSNPKLGQIYTDSVDYRIKWFNGTSWSTIGVVVEDSKTNGNIVVDGVEMTVYDLPVASTTTLGGVKVGNGLGIDENGVLHATGGGTADAVEWDNVLHKPTALSDFINDEEFIDKTVANLANYYLKSETYTQSEVNTLIGNLATIQIQVVAQLPSAGSSNIIYLVAKSVTETANIYDEYIWVASTSSYEKVGDTEIDLSNYLQKTGDGSNVTATFSTADSRVPPSTGENLAIIIGKIVKYLTDLNEVAFSGSYNDLDNKPDLVKTATLTLDTTETTKSTTISDGSLILGVTIYDHTTHDVVLCDVIIHGMTVTLNVSAAPSNALKAVISYI